jgi:hypothetical protein
MKASSGPRQLSVRHRLDRFVIATVLAGVGVLALALPVEAEIVYTPVNIKLGAYNNLDLNNDGITDFTFSFSSKHQLCINEHSQSVTPASGNGVEGSPPAALNFGDEIGPSQTFYAGQGGLAWTRFVCGRQAHGGNWWNVKGHYLGLMIQINGKTHYGWARLSFNGVAGTLTGYAYETIPSMPIKADQKK